MTTIKIITTTNWVFIGLYGAVVLMSLLQKTNPYNDAAGRGIDSALNGLGVILVLVLVGLNWLPYQWTKSMASLLILLVLLIVYYVYTN